MRVPVVTSPKWKPNTTLLGAETYGIDRKTLDFSKQWEWDLEEWREYARLLNIELATSNKQLVDCRIKLAESMQKATRRTKPIKHRPGSLLTGFGTPKRGSPKGGVCIDRATRALKLQTNMKLEGKKCTAKHAAETILADEGLAQFRIRALIEGVTSTMSRIK